MLPFEALSFTYTEPTSPHFLVLEDNEDDAFMLERLLLRRWPGGVVKQVDGETALRAALKESDWDMVLSDFRMPRFDGMSALTVVREEGRDIPFILVSGIIGEEAAVAAMKAGAQDYINKNHPSRLVPAIERELREAAGRRFRRETELRMAQLNQRYQLILASAADGIFGLDALGQLTFINPAGARMLGYSAEELLGRSMHDLTHHRYANGDLYPLEKCPIHETLRTGESNVALEDHMWRKDGTLLPIQFTSAQIVIDARVAGVVVTFSDSTLRHQAERARLLQNELEIAAQIQRGLLPAVAPSMPHLAIAGYCRQAGSIGGDGYDFLPHADGLGLLIADVSGHGIAAAILLSNFLTLYRTAATDLRTPALHADRINRHFCQTVGDSGQFVTGLIAYIAPDASQMTLAAMGHFPPLRLRAGVVSGLPQTSGLPAGFLDEGLYHEQTIDLAPGDIYLFFTDGLVECRSRRGEYFGVKGLEAALAKTTGQTPEQVLASILEDCRQFCEGVEPDDDQTAIVVIVKPKAP
jgi:PAS domain S-box-containing protein